MGPEDDLRNPSVHGSAEARSRGPICGPASPKEQLAAAARLRHFWPLRNDDESRAGICSANTGKILTSPTTHDFKSTQDGYRAVCEELQILRKRLTA